MRLKGMNKNANRNLNTSLNNNDGNNDLNGSTSSNSSVSNGGINGVDDLDIDSGDDEIDVGTHADSIGFNNSNGSKSSGSNGVCSNTSTLSNMNNDHNFGASGSSINGQHNQSNGMSEADRKRAHHNALERKRRDHIKDSFHTLRDAIPNIKGEKVSTSRAQILKAATDYIKLMRTRNADYQLDIDSIKKQNNDIENQIRQLEKAKQSINANNLGNKQINYIKSDLQVKNEPLVKNEPNLQSIDLDNNPLGVPTTSSFTTDLQHNNSAETQHSNTTTNNNNNNPTTNFNHNTNICYITKPITTTLINTSANTKKFKTIINPKNSLNIINISNSTTANLINTAVLTTVSSTSNNSNPTTLTQTTNINNINSTENDNDLF